MEYQRKYYKAHKEERLKYAKEYGKTHADEIKERYESNREHILELQKIRYARYMQNPEFVEKERKRAREKNKRYRQMKLSIEEQRKG